MVIQRRDTTTLKRAKRDTAMDLQPNGKEAEMQCKSTGRAVRMKSGATAWSRRHRCSRSTVRPDLVVSACAKRADASHHSHDRQMKCRWQTPSQPLQARPSALAGPHRHLHEERTDCVQSQPMQPLRHRRRLRLLWRRTCLRLEEPCRWRYDIQRASLSATRTILSSHTRPSRIGCEEDGCLRSTFLRTMPRERARP